MYNMEQNSILVLIFSIIMLIAIVFSIMMLHDSIEIDRQVNEVYYEHYIKQSCEYMIDEIESYDNLWLQSPSNGLLEAYNEKCEDMK